MNYFWVDDLISGTETIDKVFSLCQQICQLLKNGCFQLKKWVFIDKKCLKQVLQSKTLLNFDGDVATKTLDLMWLCELDPLVYDINSVLFKETCTKRLLYL